MPILGIIASQNYSRVAPDNGAMFPIAMVNVGSSGSSTIDFTSIPNTYKHLQIRGINQVGYSSNTLGGLNLRVGNGSIDTGSNYAYHYLRGEGSGTPSAGAASSASFISASTTRLASTDTSTFAAVVIDILDYASTSKYKTVRCLGGVDANGSGYLNFNSGLWTNSSNAITNIRLYCNDGNFNQYTQIGLFGIKG